MTMTAIPALVRTSATFRTEVDTFFASRIPTFVTEANDLEANVVAKEASAVASAAAALGAVATSGAVLWVSGTTYAAGNMVYSPITFGTFRRKTAGAGTDDPSVDAANWTSAVAITAPLPGITLLATLTPTAAANVDFLTSFSSTYDNYLIIGEGITPSAADSLSFRFANAGAVDSGSNYYTMASGASSNTAVSSGYVRSGSVYTSGGCGFEAVVSNANSASLSKTLIARSVAQSNSTYRSSHADDTVYSAANAISGIRLYWAGAANFAATGKIRVYGYAND